jgi:alkanesulfonate monooxygenase SsuD/methylene tetrahydromethanopterin reductase-like flavin-dependent oxidoreductase (luciferase family)
MTMQAGATRVELGVAIPQIALRGSVEPRLIREFLERADALGFDSAWVLDRILSPIPFLASTELLAYAAALTQRLRLGVAVLLSGLRSPMQVATSLATLDQLSEGRLMAGFGFGSSRLYTAVGLPAERRAERFTEGIKLIRRLWTEPAVTVNGPFWTVSNASVEPKPYQKPHPPIWFGAHQPAALRRAVEWGDGFVGAGHASTAEFADEVRIVRGFLAETGKNPATFGIGKRVYIAVDENRERARQRLGEWFRAIYGSTPYWTPELTGQATVAGEPDECVDGLARIVAAGARFLILNPVFDHLEHLERFASRISPKLGGASP